MKPNLIVVAGPNGAGKTTITEKLLRHKWMEGCVYINPDVIAQEKFGGWNSQGAIIKAANHAQEIREECLATIKSMAFETVFSIPEKVHFVNRAKEAGFLFDCFLSVRMIHQLMHNALLYVLWKVGMMFLFRKLSTAIIDR